MDRRYFSAAMVASGLCCTRFGTNAALAETTANNLGKIDHVVVLMLENRSFDSMLGRLYPKSGLFNGLDGSEYNSDLSGAKIFVNNSSGFDNSTMSIPKPNPGELWTDINEQIFGIQSPGPDQKPGMSGFVSNYLRQAGNSDPKTASRIMHYFTPTQVPVLSTLARQFAVSDLWFASAPCQTWPNRFFVHSATAGRRENNAPEYMPFTMPTIYGALQKSGLKDSWKIYFHEIAQSMALSELWWTPWNFSRFSKFASDCALAKLPRYSFIEPGYFGSGESDEHPPSSVAPGEILLSEVYNSLRSGPKWKSTLLIVTFDEHGGVERRSAGRRRRTGGDRVSPGRTAECHLVCGGGRLLLHAGIPFLFSVHRRATDDSG